MIERFTKRLIELLTIVILLLLAVCSTFLSVTRADGYAESFAFTWDNPLINLLFLAVFGLVLSFVGKWACNGTEKRIRGLLIAEMAFAFLFGLGFSAVSKCFPTADQASVYYGAKHFAANWFADLAETGSYFSVYPHQMALALAEEVVIRLAHTESYHVMQGINALCNALTVFCLYEIAGEVFEDKKVRVYTLIITWFCMPLFWYTPFIYGDLPSIAFSLLAAVLLIKGLKEDESVTAGKKVSYLILSGLFLLLATLVRSNSLIFVIAVAGCTLIYIVSKKKPLLLIYIVTIVTLCAVLNSSVIRFYELRSDREINDGMPAICHVVMGLQEGPMGNGYYNGYNFDTYVNHAGYDKDLAYELASADLDARIGVFKTNPGYAFDFFITKIGSQWLSSDFDCYHFTCGAYYERWRIVESLFSGSLYKATRFFMDKYSFVVYALALAGIVTLFRNRKNTGGSTTSVSVLVYILPLALIGGFIFHTVWEGAGRYVLPYFIYLIPFAAYGGTDLLGSIVRIFDGKSGSERT